MTTFKVSLFFIFVPWLSISNAADCDGWLKHLADEHKVYFQKKNSIHNSAFTYQDIPGTDSTIAIPKDIAKDWKIETTSTKEGYSFQARNRTFGYSGTFDKNGKCLNSSGFSYEAFDSKIPGSLKNRNLDFNYNWQVCQNVLTILKKRQIQVDLKNSDQVATDLKKNHLSEYMDLMNLSQAATENPFYKISRPDIPTLLVKCSLETDYIERTTQQSHSQRSSSITGVH